MAEKKLKWHPTCKRFVAFLDIMGFRDRVYRESHEDIKKMFKTFYPTITSIKKETQMRLDDKYKIQEVYNVFGKAIVKPVIFSDSIILISSDDSPESVHNILFFVGWVFKDALIAGIPLKGAIAHGEQTSVFRKSLHFGQPLIDSFDLQSELQLYGIILHHTMEKHLEKIKILKKFELFGVLKRYPVPTKSGEIYHYIIDWTSHQPVSKGDAFKLVNASYHNVSGPPRKYVDNTIEFLNWINKEKEEK